MVLGGKMAAVSTNGEKLTPNAASFTTRSRLFPRGICRKIRGDFCLQRKNLCLQISTVNVYTVKSKHNIATRKRIYPFQAQAQAPQI